MAHAGGFTLVKPTRSLDDRKMAYNGISRLGYKATNIVSPVIGIP